VPELFALGGVVVSGVVPYEVCASAGALTKASAAAMAMSFDIVDLRGSAAKDAGVIGQRPRIANVPRKTRAPAAAPSHRLLHPSHVTGSAERSSGAIMLNETRIRGRFSALIVTAFERTSV
jgi:hypothetical protein